jgi:tetratricopeptide (TPR) repeat protein
MSKKSKAPERPLSARIAQARREGRTQQALELTRALFKYEPTEAHRELLRQVTLERGQQLQANGMLRDATTVYNNALSMGGSPEFRAAVAQRLASCGAVTTALGALEHLTDPAVRQRVLKDAVDAAVARGPAGKSLLSADLHATFDLLLQAFAHYEAGRDEQARAALQGIGLQSPFLEWKVFLRGLLAFVAKDDARARENWQRLDEARLPCRLCAAMRSLIDPAYLKAQPAAVQQALRARTTQQQGLTLAPLLRDLPEMLHSDNLGPAFRKAEQAAPVLRRDHPDLLPRFAQCFFWAVVAHGNPDDLTRYVRVFGPAADDPQAVRLEALALEARGMWSEAHKVWQSFMTEVANNPAAWPGESARRVQALIWTRMAENAVPKRTRRIRSGNRLFDILASQTAPLKPNAEQCYENALKLAPDRLETYCALFELYRADDKTSKAKKLGQELLKRFPDHAETMAALGELCMDTKDYKKAQEYFEKAIQANPLERSLRGELARAKQNYALSLTLEGKHDKARAQYQQAMQLWDGSKTPLLCQWAVAEWKANNPARAEELIAQAQAEPDHRLACRYTLVGESVRAKLPFKEKKKFAHDLKTALASAEGGPTPAEVLVLLESAAHQRSTHFEAFHGQKTQEKTILKFLDGITFGAYSEQQLMRICVGLQALDARKPWFKCLNHARKHFLKNPFFRLSYVNYYLTENSRDPKTHLAREHIDDAHRLVQEMPRGELQQQYLEQIQELEKVIAEMNARNPSMIDIMDRFYSPFNPFGDDDDEDDFDDDDEYEDWW